MTIELKRWRPARHPAGHEPYMSHDPLGDYVAIDSYNELRTVLLAVDKARVSAETEVASWRWQATRLETTSLERLQRIQDLLHKDAAQFKQIASLSRELEETIALRADALVECVARDTRIHELETERDHFEKAWADRGGTILALNNSNVELRDQLGGTINERNVAIQNCATLRTERDNACASAQMLQDALDEANECTTLRDQIDQQFVEISKLSAERNECRAQRDTIRGEADSLRKQLGEALAKVNAAGVKAFHEHESTQGLRDALDTIIVDALVKHHIMVRNS